ncbi:phytanoyl-CoA dioxygenase family protein [Nitrobacter sp.]|uniref:phytanoyl-CoA dioxygenase family protein n=1 Tax=Nitrobacter sp. TaxID=29420 RepID=UPI00262576BB|nr:phytanoyl-CoA dioxygenase family protein [Nitrobacter sp.]
MTTFDPPATTLTDSASGNIVAPPVPAYRSSSLPDIDYDAHPAYGGTCPAVTLYERLHALRVFAKSFIFVTIRRVVDYENMPLLSKEAGGGRLNFASAIHYITMFASIRAQRFLRTLIGTRRAAKPTNVTLFERIKSDGVACMTLSEDEMVNVRQVIAPCFAKLDERRAAIPVERRKFDDNVYWCTRSRDSKVFETIEAVFRQHGITDVASAYLGRPVRVKHVNPQINDDNYTFWKKQFADTDVPDPWSTYLHIDATYGMLKCALYLHDIGPDGGPFCYVRGSHHAKVGWFEGMVRRTNDFCGFSGRKPEARKKFMALPRMLRKKADFGADVLDDSAASKSVREAHFAATSNYGNCVLFDGHGIHRGGMVNKGERRCVFVLLAEV